MLEFNKILKNKNKKGFTLLEALIAIAMFSMLMITATGIMVKIIFNYNQARAIQRDLENAQFAIGIMSKTLRTSSILDSTSIEIQAFDFSQNKCIDYRIKDNKLEVASQSEDKPENCTFNFGSSDFNPMTTGKINGRFNAVASDFDVSPAVIGKVAISMDIYPLGNLEEKTIDFVKIQSSVSLRDF